MVYVLPFRLILVTDFVFPQHHILFSQIFKFIGLKFYIKRRNISLLYICNISFVLTPVFGQQMLDFFTDLEIGLAVFSPHGPALILLPFILGLFLHCPSLSLSLCRGFLASWIAFLSLWSHLLFSLQKFVLLKSAHGYMPFLVSNITMDLFLYFFWHFGEFWGGIRGKCKFSVSFLK